MAFKLQICYIFSRRKSQLARMTELTRTSTAESKDLKPPYTAPPIQPPLCANLRQPQIMFRIYSAGYTTSRCDIKLTFRKTINENYCTLCEGWEGRIEAQRKGKNITYLRIICVALVGARRARNKNKNENENENERTYEKWK